MSAIAFNPDRHTYTVDGAWLPSVTGVIGGALNQPWMKRWSASVVAEHVVAHLDDLPADLQRYGPQGLLDALVSLPDRTSREAAARGTEVHALAEAVVYGAPVEVPPELGPMVQGYVDFLERMDLAAVFTECMVANRTAGYAGRFDLIATIGDDIWLLDNKTSKRVYPETALQLAAYAHAEIMQTREDGEALAMVPVDRIGVVHITAARTDLYDLGPMEPAWAEFQAALATYHGIRRRRSLVGEPVEAVS